MRIKAESGTKQLVKERFRRAGLSGVQSSWKSVNELRDIISRYVKIGNIKLVNYITKGVSAKIQKSRILEKAFATASFDLIKALDTKKIKATSPWTLKYEQDPPDPTGDVEIHIREGDGGFDSEDLKKIDDVVFYYLHDIAQPAAIDAVTKAYRLGMITGDMSEMTVPDKKIADMDLGKIVEWSGRDGFVNRLKAKGLGDDYAYAAEWARDNAMTAIAVYDDNGERAGKAYETIMRMFRDQVAYTLANGEGLGKLRTRMMFPSDWTDVEGHLHKLSDSLSEEELRQYSVAHFNRDWDRLVFDQVQRAFQAGRLTRWASDLMPTYAKFSRVRNRGKQCPKCAEWQGAILRIYRSQKDFENSLEFDGGDRVKGDNRASIATWPGKSNDDRKYKSWWICCPTHPHCNDDYVLDI